MKDTELSGSTQRVADAIGLDLSFLADDLHFDPIDMLSSMGLVLITTFWQGFAEGVRSAGTDLGRWTARTLGGRVRRLFERKEVPAASDATVAAEAAEAAARDSDVAQVDAVVDRMQRALVEYLHDERGMPAKRAREISLTVRKEATFLIRIKPSADDPTVSATD